jgi:hypothetical protein
MTVFRLSPYQTADTAITGAALNGLANTGYAWGAEIDNSVDLYPYATVTLALSGAVTSIANAWLYWFLVEPDAAGNYTVAAGDPGPSQQVAAWAAPVAGGALRYQGGTQIGRIIAPKFKIVLQNVLGVSLPADNSAVCQLRRYGDTGT